MNCGRCIPTPLSEIETNPELALVGLLQQTISMTIRSLSAAHPELCELESPSWNIHHYPSAIAARTLMRHLELLSDLLPDYRTALLAEINPDPRIQTATSDPF